jgi:ribosome biogenesis protein ENP2
MEMSWMPTTSSKDDDPSDGEGGAGHGPNGKKRKGVETFGAGMEKGVDLSEPGGEPTSRTGRSKRRSGVRSGSRNVFRNL